MICENCKNNLNPNDKVCPKCGTKVQETNTNQNNNVIINQPVVNQVIEEEHKAKNNRNNKKKILTTISILFFGLSLATIIIANVSSIENNKKEPTPSLTIEPSKIIKTKTISYNGYDVAYLSKYKASIENNLLLLNNKYLSFQITLHSNVSKELFEQNKNTLKETLKNSGYTIKSEETTIRSGIEFYVIKLSNIIDNEEKDFEYFLTVKDDILFEILVYEIEEGNYLEISNQLRTLIKDTKKVN